ncbi:unnamed protein product [marine sediment metagenome]|uniref:Uncharacterized protein n=1 Tax=marine sediment metagenome TaxID=412755 RepID=X1K8Z4_9ZZZZ
MRIFGILFLIIGIISVVVGLFLLIPLIWGIPLALLGIVMTSVLGGRLKGAREGQQLR